MRASASGTVGVGSSTSKVRSAASRRVLWVAGFGGAMPKPHFSETDGKVALSVVIWLIISHYRRCARLYEAPPGWSRGDLDAHGTESVGPWNPGISSNARRVVVTRVSGSLAVGADLLNAIFSPLARDVARRRIAISDLGRYPTCSSAGWSLWRKVREHRRDAGSGVLAPPEGLTPAGRTSPSERDRRGLHANVHADVR